MPARPHALLRRCVGRARVPLAVSLADLKRLRLSHVLSNIERMMMHICLVVNAKIPVQKYGGTERIVQWLATEFIRIGHQVTLIGLPGCELQGVTCIAATNAQEAHAAIPNNVDIVHFHAWEPQQSFRKPWIYTLHGNSNEPESLPKNTVCTVSYTHLTLPTTSRV